ncbi:MAG: OmpA family protein, partial [Candidatus Rokuibacteriota bacterium]
MAHRRGSALLAVPVLVLSLFLVGCPKRPATTAASAPPPTGSPAPSAAAPSTTPAPGGPSTMTPSPAAPGTASPTTPPAPAEFRETANLKDVYFDFDRYDIRSPDARTLDTNAAWLKTNNDLVLIEGHCDERGTNEYNLALGERRAKATMNYLVGQGV